MKILGGVLVRPERFELPTPWFEAKCSIQMSYGRVDACRRLLQYFTPHPELGLQLILCTRHLS